ncbi:hypothetical protein Aph01nite_10320 [Acrocarpospora phusangensis]|uniref:NB-ARC domain-containing protein n=1 Tax=Acrocarpospora phusangensis TaxID=1070424 RepID=A0A919QAD0_9ACTN|nr:hypothetical protein Aph01nite_10320 [Acrocarpospora phusangensis]
MQGFVTELRRLKSWAGNPSLDRLRQTTGIARSTLSDALSPRRTRLPALDLVADFVRACGRPPDEVAAWVAAWRRIHGTAQTLAEPPTGPIPRQLPTSVRHFVGRDRELAALDELARPDAATVMIMAIDGGPGVGKTSIAVHWAHRAAARFPDGQLFVNLRGFDPDRAPMLPAEAIRGFLDAFAVPADRIPRELDAQAALYRSLLADRRILVVLDNARDVDHVRPLLPGSPACAVVVTSRTRLTGLVAAEGARSATLDLLDAAESEQLLRHHLGAERVAAEPVAVAALIDLCARLPLALTIAAARALFDPATPLAALAAQLADARERLDLLDTGDPATALRAVFSWSYDALDDESARLFRLLALHPGPEITAPAAASLVGHREVRRVLGELTRTHLINEQVPGRFTLHDLLRAYATELVETDSDRFEAQHRILDHYLHTAHTASLLLHPYQEPLPLPPPRPGVVPEQPRTHQDALTWFSGRHAVLLAAVEHAASAGFPTHAWQLAATLTEYLDRQGHWQDWLTTQHAALDIARRSGDPRGEAVSQRGLARASNWLHRHENAIVHFGRALELYTRLDDPAGMARVHRGLSHSLGRLGRHAEALERARQALDLLQDGDDPAGEAVTLNAVGWHLAQLGQHREAWPYCDRALTLLYELGDHSGQAYTWDTLGYIHHHLGEHQRAASCYRHAITLYQELGVRYHEAESLIHLGDVQAASDTGAARGTWRRALSILDDLGHPDADGVRAKLAVREN